MATGGWKGNEASLKPLREASAKKKKGANGTKPVSFSLTEEAIAHGTSAADTLNISRSELIERLLRTLHIMDKLQQQYHLTIRTPFDIGEPYFAGATPLGSTGWNGKPDYEASGTTFDEAVKNLANLIDADA